jgi:hypothetical protein
MRDRAGLHRALDTVIDLSAARGAHKKALEEAVAYVKREYPKYLALVDKVSFKLKSGGPHGLCMHTPSGTKIELYPQKNQELAAAYVAMLRHELEHAMQFVVAREETKTWSRSKFEEEAYRAQYAAGTKYYLTKK